MPTGRPEAFTDGVLAILITIMVLELRPPHEPGLAGLRPLVPVLLSYLLSFVFIGIYWNNHHHLLQASRRVGGAVLWANLHLLFWLSLVPFTTAWVGDTRFAPTPVAAYGAVLLMASLAYYLLQRLLIRRNGVGSALAMALAVDWKGKVSPLLYVAAIPLAFASRWVACGLYVAVALMWLIPDPRIERALAAPGRADP